MSVTVAFDVDGTLITQNIITGLDHPRYDIIQMMRLFIRCKDITIYVWSGSGIEYAERWVEKLGIGNIVTKVVAKGSFIPDIAIDDMDVSLGKVNIKV